MAERLPRTPVHRSIFVRLVAVMVVMAVSLLCMVAWFFIIVLRPSLGEHHGRVLGELTRRVAADAPDLEQAKGIATRAMMPIRYEGPAGAWSTSDELPSIAQVRADGPAASPDHVLRDAPDGGTYLFTWNYRKPLQEAHNQLVLLLLALIAGVVVVAHTVLSRALRPIRSLQEGVARLGDGDLDVVVVSRSKDELGALTDAFNHMAGRVRDMVRARDQLLLDVSHELRSPLTRMRVALALLPPGDKTERLLTDVVEMETKVNELLELERLREGQGLQRASVDLVPVLRDLTAGFTDAPGVRVASLPPALRLDGDAEKLRTALRNVVENAVKYSLPDSRPVEVSAEQTKDTIVVRVIDDGPGIPEADLPRLFEPFFRVDRSRSKKTGGYGLGLSLCRRIMQAHGGDVVAENNAGARGATFRLTLPAISSAPS